MVIVTTIRQHPEEIECFRMPHPEGRFSPEKRYEYTYATRKSWEYIPHLGRNDWRYFTYKAFVYAGKWLRSEQRGFGDGGDYWEVFQSNDGRTETTVSWDYDGAMCYRECPYNDILMDEMIKKVEEVGESEREKIHKTPRVLPDKPWSLATLSCIKMKGYYGAVVFSLISVGVLCFLMDRMGYAPLHSVWHILSSAAITLSLYYVVVNGTL